MWDLLPIPLPEMPVLNEGALNSWEEKKEAEVEIKEEEVEDGGCEGCGGFDDHSPNCLIENEERSDTPDNKTMSDNTTEIPQFSRRRNGSEISRERTKSTAYNFTKNPIKKDVPTTLKTETNTSPDSEAIKFIDIHTAFNILISTTNTSCYFLKPISCNLRHPMYPGFSEPYYVFTLQKPVLGSLYIGIGSVGGGVRVFGGGQGGAVRRLSDGGEGTVGDNSVGEGGRRGSIGVS